MHFKAHTQGFFSLSTDFPLSQTLWEEDIHYRPSWDWNSKDFRKLKGRALGPIDLGFNDTPLLFSR